MPSPVLWAYGVGGLVLAIGLVAIFRRSQWREVQNWDILVLFGPVFYGAPIAAFGTEHFTLTAPIATMIPAWLPWHLFWTYLVGACFIAAGLSLATGIYARFAAPLLALTFFLFVALMEGPGYVRHPRDRIILAVVLREIAFSAGALALASQLNLQWTTTARRTALLIARCSVAATVLFFSLEQFLHGDYVPAVPMERQTPQWLLGHDLWTYAAAVAYAVCGALLLIGKKARAAATYLGAVVLFIELIVYAPIGIIDRNSLDLGLNYVADTLLFGGTVLLLAGAIENEEGSPVQQHRRRQPAQD